MKKSESIENLAKALCNVQRELRGFKEDSTNPFYNSKYGDLTSVWAAIRKPLTDNGLSVVQTLDDGSEGCVVVETTLLHASGEWISGRLEIKPDKAGPQAVVSAITYGRRTSLSAITGIAPEDDDGNGATNPNSKPKSKPPAKPATKPKAKPAAKPKERSQLTELYELSKQKLLTDQEWKDVCGSLGIEKDKRTQTKERMIDLRFALDNWKSDNQQDIER